MAGNDIDMDAQRQAYLAGIRQELLALRSRAVELVSQGVAESDGSYSAVRQRLEEADRLLERMSRCRRSSDWRDDAVAMTSLCADVGARVAHLGAQVHASAKSTVVPVAGR